MSRQSKGLLESPGVLPRFSPRCRERTPCGSARGMEVLGGPFGRLRAGSSTPPNQSFALGPAALRMTRVFRRVLRFQVGNCDNGALFFVRYFWGPEHSS